MSENVGHLRAEFSIDLSPLERGLRRARQMMERFDDDSSEAELTLSTRSFDRSLANARRKLSDLSNEEGEVDIGANLSPLQAGLTRARGMLSRIRGQRANVVVGANTAAATANLANVRRFVTNLNGSRAAVNVSAVGAPGALMTLGAVNRAAGALNGRNAIVNIGTRGAAGAVASMVAVRTAAAALGAGATAGINRFNKASLFMGNVASYGARMGIFSLVGAFGPLIGMAGVATSALASVGAGFGLLGLAAIPTMRALSGEAGKLTASQRELKAEAKGFYAAFERAFAPATTRVEQLATATMRYARGALPALGQTAAKTADAVGRAGAHMRKQFDDPRQLALFNEFLSRVPNMTRLFTQAAGQFGLGIFNMLVAAQPVAQDFLRYLNRITLQFSKWSSSAEGQRQMRQFFESVTPVARALGRAIAAVTVGLFKLTTQPAVIGFFTKLLNAITFIGQRIQPALTPLFQGLNAIATGFTKIPEPIRSAATTVGIFAAAVAFLAGGPLIILGSIVGRVASAFRLFSAAGRLVMGPLKTLAPAARAVRGPFMMMGSALRLAAAPFRLLAAGARLLMSPLRLLTSVGRLVAAPFRLLGPLFTRIGAVLTRVVPFFARLGGAFTRIVPLVARFVPWIARIALIGAIANPIGLVVTAITLLGTAFIIAYRRSETFRNAVNAVGNFIRTVAVAAFRALVNAARAVWQWFSRLPAPIQFLISPIGALINIGRRLIANWSQVRARGGAIWNGLKALVVGVARGIAAGARAAWNVLKAVTIGIFTAARVGALASWRALKAGVVAIARGVAAGARAAWNLLKTVTGAAFRAAVAIARGVWNGLKAVVIGGARAAANGARAAWNLLRSVTTTAFNAIRSIARSVWNGVKTVVLAAVRAVGSGVRAGWNAVRSVTTSVFNGIRNFMRSLWSGIQGIFDSALRAIGNRVRSWTDATRRAFSAFGSWARGHWNSFWRFVRNLWDSALRAIGNRVDSWRNAINNAFSAFARWARGHWQSFWTFVRNLWDSALRAIGDRVDSWRRAINNAFSAFASWARGHWQSFWRFVRNLWDDALRAIGNRVDSWRNAINNRFSALASWARGHWSRFWDFLRNMWDKALSAIGDRARSWGNAIKSLFQKIKGWMTNPMESARDILKGIWNGILGGIGKVLGAVGLKDAAGKVNGAKWAKGGTTQDGGGQAFARGGVTAFRSGGMGTGSKQPRMHLWNEQMGNEAYITERGNKRKQMNYLNTAAGWHGARVVPQNVTDEAPKDPPPRNAHSHINDAMSRATLRKTSGGTRGAHADFSRNHKNVYDYIKKRADDVASNVGGVSWNTYHHHITAPGANEHSSVDFWAPGGPGAAIGSSKGKQTADYVVKNHAAGNLGTIWNRQVSTGGGWRGFSGGPHLDHVHVGWSTDPNAKIVNGGGVGGMSIPNPMQILFDKMWNNTVGKTMKGFRSQMKGGHVMRQGTAAAATMTTQAIHKWIDDQIPDTIGGGGSSSGPGTDFQANSNRELGKKMNDAMGWGGQWGSLDKLWQKESGWSHTAQNPTSSAYGIPQAMVSAHNMPKGYGPPGGDPAVQIDWGLGYIKGRYGDPNSAWGHSQRVGWYQRGGVVPGFRPQPAVLHGGERVLPRDLNTGFESLANSIENWNSRTAPTPRINADSRDYRELIGEVRALREEVRHQTDTVPAATGAAVKSGTDSNLEHDRNTREAADRGQQRVARKRRKSGGH